MEIEMRSLLAKESSIPIHESFTLPYLSDEPQILGSSPLEADLEAKASNGIAEIKGHVTVELELICSRCLSSYKQSLKIPFRELFTQDADLTNQSDDEDEIEIHFVKENRLELNPYLEQQVLLAVPYVPLCDESCKGLCPVCGINHNEQACDCKQEKIDPRLAGLADFFKE